MSTSLACRYTSGSLFDGFSLRILSMGGEELLRNLYDECLPSCSLLEFRAGAHGTGLFDLLNDAEHGRRHVDDEAAPLADLRLIEQADGKLEMTTNGAMALPEVDMEFATREYRQLLETIERSAAGQEREKLKRYANSQFWLARNLDRALRSRYSTMRRVVQQVVCLQEDWFRRGWGFLRPLTRKAVAGQLGLCPTTVERAVRNKHMGTVVYGVIPVEALFPSCLATRDGRSVLHHSVRSRLVEILSRENTTRPLSDVELTAELARAGFDFPRRTITRFRNEQNIPPARQRRMNRMNHGGSRA